MIIFYYKIVQNKRLNTSLRRQETFIEVYQSLIKVSYPFRLIHYVKSAFNIHFYILYINIKSKHIILYLLLIL